ncbi:hypothetical protein Peur_055966 [Populus x canadensis]
MESVQEEIRAQLESQNTSLNFEVEKLGLEKRSWSKKSSEIYKEQFTLLIIVKKKQAIKMVKMVEEASSAQEKIAGLEKINDALHKQCS